MPHTNVQVRVCTELLGSQNDTVKRHSMTLINVTVKKLMNCRICFQVIYFDIIHQKVHMNNKCLKNKGKKQISRLKGVKLN